MEDALLRRISHGAYQVKLLIDPCRVLDAGGTPLERAVVALRLGAPGSFEVAQYLDDAERSLSGQGWILRMRRHDDEGRVRLAYKARFGIDGDGTDPAALARALERAGRDGFGADGCFRAARVNLSHARATLDFSAKRRAPAPYLAPGELPGPEASRALALDRLPDGLWQRAQAAAAGSLIHGPVRQTNHPGRILDHPVELQVSRLRTGPDGERTWFAEITAKAGTFPEVLELRALLMGKLRAEGWLLEQDAFKTDLILTHHRMRAGGHR
ncbi:hypothetical protein [Streptomyces sp. NPDC060031]|uniref:hypothetical protein n=1 Tax=Streptomyces sp. NPDC060031 TaxID=3347043 RepID=UPI003687C7CA